MTIIGGAGLGDFHGTHHIARRQEERCFLQTAEVDVTDLTGKAGLTGYYDENSWYLLALTHDAKGYSLTVTERAGLEEHQVMNAPWDAPKATLRVKAAGMRRTLQVQKQGQWVTLAELVATYLTDEGLKLGKRFTGAVLGMMAKGSGKAVFRHREEIMTEGDAQ